MFKKALQKVKVTLFATLIVLVGTVGLAAPALAASYFEVTLASWCGKTWVASGHKNGGSTTYYVEVVKHSPKGGHFWVDDKNGNFIGNGIDVDAGGHRWGAYQNKGYDGYVTLYGRTRGCGSFTDKVIGWFNPNG